MSWCASLPPAFWKGYRSLIPEEPGFRKRADRSMAEALYESGSGKEGPMPGL